MIKIDTTHFPGIAVNELVDQAMAMYLNCSEDAAKALSPFPKTSPLRRRENESRLNLKLDALEQEIGFLFQNQPDSAVDLKELTPEQQIEVKTIISKFLLDLDKDLLLFHKPFLAFFINEGYLDTAEVFIQRAQREEKELTFEEIFQALRNVWIMNSLQLFWNLPLAVTPSVYAYSMLYPYTDNFLDDPTVSVEEKAAFNDNLTRALLGQDPAPKTFHEKKVASLVAQIQSQYPRAKAPTLWQSLLLIQDGQVQSLKQSRHALETQEILALSFYKGGASVLTDAFLVKGELDPGQRKFAFSYGAFLQLLDDFQDTEEDRSAGHMTLFSSRDPHGYLDAEVIKLIAFITLCNAPEAEDNATMEFMKEVITSSTLIMVLAAATKHPTRISKKLTSQLEEVSSIPLTSYPALERRFQEIISPLIGKA